MERGGSHGEVTARVDRIEPAALVSYRGCMRASGFDGRNRASSFGVVPACIEASDFDVAYVDRIVMNVLVIEVQIRGFSHFVLFTAGRGRAGARKVPTHRR